MELIENLLQLLVTFAGACLAGFAYWKSRAQKYFLLFCFYGCFALGALYWTLYLLLFGATPRVFYVSEFGWVASMIFLRILQATLSGPDERAFRCRVVWLAPLFGVAGMGVCLLSAYINTFLAAVYQADALAATVEIAPVVEEVMKLLPLVFYLLVFEPEAERIKPAAITAALSFATFENVCYLIQNGAGRFSFIFFRGFGTGAMHVLCGLIVGGGLTYAWQRTWLKIAGTCGLLGAAITLHAIYNLLIAYGGTAQYIAYVLPVLLITAGKLRIFRSLGGSRLA
ncbi:MAG: PrsW family glutamic-type intramembrane protease [Oscillospiraceae bacterium]